STVGMVLLSHGVFSFGPDARASYELMIELVSMAEEYLAKKKAWHVASPTIRAEIGPGMASGRTEIAKLRRAISDQAEFPVILKVNDSEKFIGFARRPNVQHLSGQGTASTSSASPRRRRKRRRCSTRRRAWRSTRGSAWSRRAARRRTR